MDIIPDSQERGQCYIPLDYLTDDDYKLLTQERNPYQVDHEVLKQCVSRLIKLYRKLKAQTIDALKLCPNDAQRYLLIMMLILNKVGDAVEKHLVYERDIKINKFDLFFTALKGMYFVNPLSLL